MFGFQGDYFNYQANAILLLYSLNGNKLASIIREEDNSYSFSDEYIEETEDYIVINKPKGMLVHGKNSVKMPKNRARRSTMRHRNWRD